jgi:hypothetical protein
MFASNWDCVTSESAKAAPAGGDCSRGIDCARRSSLAWREPVCAITRRTSKDSAGTYTHPRRAAQNSQHERHPVGRTRTEWHHDCANVVRTAGAPSGRPCIGSQGFSSGKNLPAAGPVRFAVFSAVGNQGGFPYQSERCVAGRRRRKMAVAQCANSALT